MISKDNKLRLKRLLDVMLPILITQTAIMAMNFLDSAMSGHMGAVHLAGTAIGGNVWMPIMVGINGVLFGSMPIIAHLIGAGERQNIGNVVRHTLLLAFLFSLVVIIAGLIGIEAFLKYLKLEEEVQYIAKFYMAGIGMGIIPFFMSTALRALVDTLGHTDITMKIYLSALPVNACLNYCFIFGKFGAPQLGGIGAGVATGITWWLEFFVFVYVTNKLSGADAINVFKERFKFSAKQFGECLKIGVPIGLATFVEGSIFGVIAFFVAKFGTVIIAAHQAALGFTSLLYMVPLSFCMALTIIIGVEVGAKRFDEAKRFSRLGVAANLSVAFLLMLFVLFNREFVARLYTNDPEIIKQTVIFLFYAVFFQMLDATAAPIQGILRGYKDVKATFYSGLAAYWVVCLPLGCLLDFGFDKGAISYWISLDIGLLCSATFLLGRVLWLQRKIERTGEL